MIWFTLLLSKKLFLLLYKTYQLFLLFLNSQKLPLGEPLWLTRYYATPEVTLFFIITMLLIWTPYHASGHLVIFTVSDTDLRERILLSGVFYLTLSASFKDSLGPEG